MFRNGKRIKNYEGSNLYSSRPGMFDMRITYGDHCQLVDPKVQAELKSVPEGK